MNAEIDISNTVLRTERLTLRPWKLRDIDDMFAYAKDPEVGPNAGWLPHESKYHTVPILLKFIEEKKTFAVEYNGRAVGSLGIEKYDEAKFPELADKKCRELGFVLAKECWGMGLMTEAVNAVIRYLFDEVGLDAILCGHFLHNKRSARVQEKCGFRHYAFCTLETPVGTMEEEMTILMRM